MGLILSILYGLLSGFAEFLPVSSSAHQALLLRLSGQSQRDPFCDLLVHAALFFAVIIANRHFLLRLSRENRLMKANRRNRKLNQVSQGVYDLRLVKTAAIPMMLVLLLQQMTRFAEGSYLLLAVFLLINGLVLYIPEHVRQANKEARHMTRLDGFLIGVCSGFSIIPGISRVALGSGIASLRGAGRQNACSWVLLLSIPALAVFIGFDIVTLLSSGFQTIAFGNLPGYLAAAGSAFVGGWCAILLLRFLSVRSGYGGFAFYSWGAAMFALIIYMIT